jgi:hypothetical protein
MLGTGNSDSHSALVGRFAWGPALGDPPHGSSPVGGVANLIRCPDSEPGEDCIREAFRTGEITVSNGPIVHMVVRSDQTSVTHGATIQGNAVTVDVRVQAADWVPVQEVRLIENGIVVERVSIDRAAGVLDQTFTFSRTLMADSWLIAEAGYPIENDRPDIDVDTFGDYARVQWGQVPVGFTNWVLVDANADGRWTSPGFKPYE